MAKIICGLNGCTKSFPTAIGKNLHQKLSNIHKELPEVVEPEGNPPIVFYANGTSITYWINEGTILVEGNIMEVNTIVDKDKAYLTLKR